MPIALIIGLVNTFILIGLWQTIGWHDLRGYHEKFNGLVVYPLLSVAAANLLFAGIVGPYKRLAGVRRQIVVTLVVSAIAVTASTVIAPPIGKFLNRNLLLPTPLIEAARYGDAVVVMEKVKRGADPNIRHPALDETPLHYMASRGEAEAVEFLLRHGADPNAQAHPSSKTPLHNAVFHQANPRTIRLLLEYGADPKLADWNGQTPLSMADPETLAILRRAPIREAARPANR